MEYLYIHFQIEWGGHEIPIALSIAAEEAIVGIVETLNRWIFKDNLSIEIKTCPVENGSFLKVVKVTAYLAWMAILWNICNGFVMGLWDGRSIDELTRDGIIEIKSLVVGFFEKESSQLVDIGIDPIQFRQAYEYKNNFYRISQLSQSITGIWFSNNEEFPIPREAFWSRIINIVPNDENLEPVDKFHKLKVISPVNTEEDKELVWHVKDIEWGKRFGVYMKDDSFYEAFLLSPILIHAFTVQVRYFPRMEGDTIKTRREIIKVFEYDGVTIHPLPGDAIIERAPLTFGTEEDEENLHFVSSTNSRRARREPENFQQTQLPIDW